MVSTSFSFGEKLLIDDGRNIQEWVTHSEEDSVAVRGSHDDESDKRERERERLRFRSCVGATSGLVVSEAL